MNSNRLAIFLCLCLCVLPLCALADRVNLKPGLWEMTTRMESNGKAMPGMPTIPPEALAKMSSEQRARIESMMKSHSPAGRDQVFRSCVTEADLEKGIRPHMERDDQSCKVASATVTRTGQEIHMSCTGHMSGTGVMKITALGPEAIESTMDLDMAQAGGEHIQMKTHTTGKWLGADCGSLKSNTP